MIHYFELDESERGIDICYTSRNVVECGLHTYIHVCMYVCKYATFDALVQLLKLIGKGQQHCLLCVYVYVYIHCTCTLNTCVNVKICQFYVSVNVNRPKSFLDAAQQEKMREREALEAGLWSRDRLIEMIPVSRINLY